MPNPHQSTKEPALMHPSQRIRIHQQKRIKAQAENSDTYAFFNLLTGPEFLDQVEQLLPDHRERLFPPTETLSMFLAQAMNQDRSCQSIVDDADYFRRNSKSRGKKSIVSPYFSIAIGWTLHTMVSILNIATTRLGSTICATKKQLHMHEKSLSCL
ncbi:MAG: hypothetical protein GY792_35200 [Gammaproteobacteria bacterium]|nr:hypothetical protein [Gammaproteobacteria bacterium]